MGILPPISPMQRSFGRERNDSIRNAEVLQTIRLLQAFSLTTCTDYLGAHAGCLFMRHVQCLTAISHHNILRLSPLNAAAGALSRESHT